MIGIVVPLHEEEEEEYVKRTIKGIEETSFLPHKYYFVGNYNHPIENPKGVEIEHIRKDVPRGTARNIGGTRATGDFMKFLYFIDAHMEFEPEWAQGWDVKLVNLIYKNPKIICSPTLHAYGNEHQKLLSFVVDPRRNFLHKARLYPDSGIGIVELPSLCGCSQFMSSEVFSDSIFGYLPDLQVEDIEFCMRMWTFGYRCAVDSSISVGHLGKSGIAGWNRERSIGFGVTRLLYALLHFDFDVAHKVYAEDLSGCADKEEAWRVATSRYWQKIRKLVQGKRVRSAKEYFDKWC